MTSPSALEDDDCSCSSSFYESESDRASVMQYLSQDSKADTLYNGKCIPLKERKLLRKLVRTRAVYDDIRAKLVSDSTISSNKKLRKKRRAVKKRECEKDNSAILEIVNVVDRGDHLDASLHREYCDCCLCSSKNQRRDRNAYDISECQESDDVLMETKRRGVRLNPKYIKSDPCVCLLSDFLKKASGSIKRKLRPGKSMSALDYLYYTIDEDSLMNKRQRLRKLSKASYEKLKESGSYIKNVLAEGSRKINKSRRYLGDKLAQISKKRHKRRKNTRDNIDGIDTYGNIILKIRKDSISKFQEVLLKKQNLKDWEIGPDYIEDNCDLEECLVKLKLNKNDTVKRPKKRKTENSISIEAQINEEPSFSQIVRQKKERRKERKYSQKAQIQEDELNVQNQKTNRGVGISYNSKISKKKDRTNKVICLCDSSMVTHKDANTTLVNDDSELRYTSFQENLTSAKPTGTKKLKHKKIYALESQNKIGKSKEQKRKKKDISNRSNKVICLCKADIALQNSKEKQGRRQQHKHNKHNQYISQIKLKHSSKDQFGKHALKRCFCTLKFKAKKLKIKNNKNRQTETSESFNSILQEDKISKSSSMKPTKERSNKEILYRSYSYPRECKPGHCNTIYCSSKKCVQKNKRMKCTGHGKVKKSTVSLSTIVPVKTGHIQSRINKNSSENIRLEKSNKEHRRAVKVSSNFSFNIEFSKDIKNAEVIPSNCKNTCEGPKPSQTKRYKRNSLHKYNTQVQRKEKNDYTNTPKKRCKRKMVSPCNDLEVASRGIEMINRGTKINKNHFVLVDLLEGRRAKKCNRLFLESLECEPYTCISGNRSRGLKHISTTTDMPAKVSVSSCTYKKKACRNKCLQSKIFIKEEKNFEKNNKKKPTKFNYEQYSECSPETPSRKAVRLSSSFSFSIEFYKERSPRENLNENYWIEPNKITCNKKVKHRGINNSSIYADSSAQVKTNKRNKTSLVNNMIKRCFCTLNFAKNRRNTKILNNIIVNRVIVSAVQIFAGKDTNRASSRSCILENNNKKINKSTFFYRSNANYTQSDIMFKYIYTTDIESVTYSTDYNIFPNYNSHLQTNKRIKYLKNNTSHIQCTKYNCSKDHLILRNKSTKSINYMKKCITSKDCNIYESKICTYQTTNGLNQYFNKYYCTLNFQTRYNKRKGLNLIKLDPYEYEPGICVPGECNPLPLPQESSMKQAVCIGSNFSFNLEFYKDHPSMLHQFVSTKPQITQITSGEAKKRKLKQACTKGIEVNCTDKCSQLDVSMTNRSSCTSPLDKRCFCTLKLQNRGQMIRNEDINKKASTQLNMKPIIQDRYVTRSQNTFCESIVPKNFRKLAPYECEPGVCVPGLCDPYECLDRINKRKLIQCRNLGTMTTCLRKPTGTYTNRQVLLPFTKKTRCRNKSTKCYTETQKDLENVCTDSEANPQRVRIGSSFSFNVEFCKEHKEDKQKRVRTNTIGTHDCIPKRKCECKAIQKCTEGQHAYCQSTGKSYCATTMTSSPKRCFCTAKLNTEYGEQGILQKCFCLLKYLGKKGQIIADKDTETPYPNARECLPGMCIPGECDPRVCYKMLNLGQAKKRAQCMATCTELATGKSAACYTCKSTNKNIKTQSRLPKDLRNQCVRIGSNFSFNIEFSKKNRQTFQSNEKKYFKKRPKSTLNKQGTICTPTLRTKQIQEVDIKKDCGVNFTPFYKRCFCTLKLKRDREKVRKVKPPKLDKMKSIGIMTIDKYKCPSKQLLPFECEPNVCIPYDCDPYICDKRIKKRLQNECYRECSTETDFRFRPKRKNPYTIHKDIDLKLLPFECEPQTCVPGECNPLECLERIKVRELKNKDNELCTTNCESKSIGNGESIVNVNSIIKYLQAKNLRHKDIKTPHRKIQTKRVKNRLPTSRKNILRYVGSGLNFNIEFLKDKPEKVKLNKKLQKLHPTQVVKTQSKAISSKSVMSSISPILKRCFCTLQLQKHNQKQNTVKIQHSPLEKNNTQFAKSNQTKQLIEKKILEKYECEPGVCIPGQCNPYECIKLIRKRHLKDFSTDTKPLYETVSSDHSCQSECIQPRKHVYTNPKPIKIHKPYKKKIIASPRSFPPNANKNVVRIGSNFGFTIDFSKSRPTGHRQRNVDKVRYVKNKQDAFVNYNTYMPNRPCQTVVNKRKDQSSFTRGILERCFCTKDLMGRSLRKNNIYITNTAFLHNNMPYKCRTYRKNFEHVRMRPGDFYEGQRFICKPLNFENSNRKNKVEELEKKLPHRYNFPKSEIMQMCNLKMFTSQRHFVNPSNQAKRNIKHKRRSKFLNYISPILSNFPNKYATRSNLSFNLEFYKKKRNISVNKFKHITNTTIWSAQNIIFRNQGKFIKQDLVFKTFDNKNLLAQGDINRCRHGSITLKRCWACTNLKQDSFFYPRTHKFLFVPGLESLFPQNVKHISYSLESKLKSTPVLNKVNTIFPYVPNEYSSKNNRHNIVASCNTEKTEDDSKNFKRKKFQNIIDKIFLYSFVKHGIPVNYFRSIWRKCYKVTSINNNELNKK